MGRDLLALLLVRRPNPKLTRNGNVTLSVRLYTRSRKTLLLHQLPTSCAVPSATVVAPRHDWIVSGCRILGLSAEKTLAIIMQAGLLRAYQGCP